MIPMALLKTDNDEDIDEREGGVDKINFS